MILYNNIITNKDSFSEKIFEDGLNIYEVIRIFNQKPIFLQDNLLRLQNSIKKCNLDIDIPNLHIEDKLNRFIQLEHIQQGNLKYILRITKDNTFDEYIYQIPHSYPTRENYDQGINTVTCLAMRENPEVKYVNGELRTMADQLIKEKQVFEVLLVDQEGFITEGSRSNVFFIKHQTLFTASTRFVLPGTSRKRVLDICKELGFPVTEERVAYSALTEYEAAFITGTSPLVLPIHYIDDILFDSQNPVLKEVMNAYFSMMKVTF